MTITFTILPVIPSNVPAHRLRLPPFEASTEDKRGYLQQVFPDDQISEFDPDDLFAYYCASTVQWMVRPEDRSDFLNRYAQLMAGQLDTRYYDSLTSQGNTIIFNAVGQINIPVVKDFLQSMCGASFSDRVVYGFCSWLIAKSPQSYRYCAAVLGNFEIYHKDLSEQRARAADDLFLLIAQDACKQEVVTAAKKLQNLAGDFAEAINAAIGDERRLEQGEEICLSWLLEDAGVSRKVLAKPLLSAISAGQTFRFPRIMSHAPDVSDMTIADFHGAFKACPRDRSGFATMLLMEHFGLNEPDPQTGDCLIHLAAEWGDFELVKTLVQWGANPQVPNHQGKTPFMHLSPEQQMEVWTLVMGKREQ